MKTLIRSIMMLFVSFSLSLTVNAQTYTNGVQPDLADPHVLTHDGTYYLYGTYTPGYPNMRDGIPVYSSKDLVNWTSHGWALHQNDSWGNQQFWAPEVIYKDGLFYMYYAVQERLAVATSTSPLGPFVQTVKEPMHLNIPEIDAHVFTDAGKDYIYFVRFNNGNEIWGAELNADMKTINESTLTFIMRPTQAWELQAGQINEGAFIIKHNDKFYMTYSGNTFDSPVYGVGYAVADSPLGPYVKYEGNPILQSNDRVHGAGHHSITKSPDGTELFMVYHRHHSLSTVEPRRIAIDRMWFEGDILRVSGPSITPQLMPSGAVNTPETAGIESGSIYKLVSKHSGKVVEVNAAELQNGANVQQWSDFDNANQQWLVEWQNDGYYKLTNKLSGKVLDVDATSLDEAHNVQQWQDLGGDSQRWKIVSLDDGSFKLLAKNSGFALDLNAWGTHNGANLIQWPDGGSVGGAQHFDFVKVSTDDGGTGNSVVRFQSHNFPDSYIRQIDGRARIDSQVSPVTDSEFIQVQGLAGGGISFESTNTPGKFLRHKNGAIYVDSNDGSDLFAADATFIKVPGLADANASSFHSFNYPDQYIRHVNSWLKIDFINSELDRADATFVIQEK